MDSQLGSQHAHGCAHALEEPPSDLPRDDASHSQPANHPDPAHHPQPAHHPDPASHPQPARPRLMRVSEIDRECDPGSPLRSIVGWIRGFLARPHPQLGRPGLVCPFVPGALKLDTIWLAEMPDTAPSFEHISSIMTEYRTVFQQMEPRTGPEAMNKVFLLVFPALSGKGAEGAAVIEEVHASLKPSFVDIGMLVGEFHAVNEGAGLRNPDFRPLRSPLPMLAMRHLVESDLPFLTRDFYSPQLRSAYLRSYLFRLGGALSQAKFNEAVEALLAAEISIASNTA